MRIKEITCTNSIGEVLSISKSSDVFKPVEDIDMTGLKANTTYATNYRVHGSTAIASRLEQRDFSLLFYISVQNRGEKWIQEQRDKIFKVFNPICNPIRVEIKTETKNVYVEANVEVTPSIAPGVSNTNNIWQKVMVQFSAGNPFFQDTEIRKVEIANWMPVFEFPIEISDDGEGEEMGQRSSSLIVNVLNDGQVSTGMKIQFKALSTVLNPSLFNVNTRQYFKVNKVMSAGEIITINTYQGQKRVEMLLDGETSNIFNQMAFGSKFMQLDVGDNLFRYDADSNPENLEVSIYFTPQYLGV